MSWELDFTETTAKDVDAKASSLPDGYYRVRLNETHEDPQSGNQVLDFTVCYGPRAGKKRIAFLQNPAIATNQEIAMKKAMIWATRMGLVQGADGKKVALDWQGAVGKEFVIEVGTRSYDKNGETKTTQEVTFAGIWPLDHTDLTNDIRRALGLPEVAGLDPVVRGGRKAAAATTTAKPPQSPAEAKASAESAAKALWG